MALPSRTQLERPILRLLMNPSFGRVSLRFFYPRLTRLLRSDDVVFLNLGYEEDPPMGLPLSGSDEADRYPIQLYHRTVSPVDLSGKRVLEVSCGHGGGASYITRSFHPDSYVAVDLNKAAIEYCRKKHHVAGLNFVHGNAESLPFADEQFDAVINIEASGHYFNFEKFLNEVARVLRPGAHFLYSDLRRSHLMSGWEAALAAASMRELSHETINAEVLRALDKNSPRLVNQIGSHLPQLPLLHDVLYEFAGGPGSLIRSYLESREVTYRVYNFVKV